MSREIERLKDHVIIVGYGRLGHTLADHLSAERCPFLVIDIDEDRTEIIQRDGYLALAGDAEDEDTLLNAGVQRARALAAVLPDDAMNVFITLTARNLNPSLKIIARGERRATHSKLLQAGASHVVMPAALSGHAMAEYILDPQRAEKTDREHAHAVNGAELAELGMHTARLRVNEGDPVAGRALGEVEAHGQAPFIVLALVRENGDMLYRPEPGTTLAPGDDVVVVGPAQEVPVLTPKARALPEPA